LNEPTYPEATQKSGLSMAKKSDSEGVGCLILVAIVVAFFYYGYSGIDSVGWIPHREDSLITAQANWFVGETKECSSNPLPAQAAKVMGKVEGDAVYQIECDKGPEHKVNIEFYGKKVQPENALAFWNCTRKEDTFLCKQTGALPSKSEDRPYVWSADPHRVSCKERPNCATSSTCMIVDADQDQCRDLSSSQ
jgi:hypothetical protein